MDFLHQARRSFEGNISPQGKLSASLQLSLQVSFLVSLFTGAACIGSAAVANYCPECIAFAQVFGGLLIATSGVAGLMTYIRSGSASTQSKVIMHPWSFKDLVEVSLTTGTVTIGVADIILVYGYHFLLLLDTAAALSGFMMISESLSCLRTDALLFWTIASTCSIALIGVTALGAIVCGNLPYGALEYSKIYVSNFGSALSSIGGHLKSRRAVEV